MNCPSCGGVVGRDCFNPEECMAITRDMADRYQQEAAELNAACEAATWFASGWEWEMLPNGERGWRWNGYLRDDQLRQLLSFAAANARVELPKELKPACEYCEGTGSILVDFEHRQWITCEACRNAPRD